MEHGRGVRRDPQSSSIPTPLINQGRGTLNPLYRTGGTYSQNGVMDFPRYPISELHLVKFLDTLEFGSWKVNFKTEVCTNSEFPQITMYWIEEVEIAKSSDDLMTSRSITGRTDFPDYEMLDAKIVSALKKLLTHVHFSNRVSVEEQRAQKDVLFLRGRHGTWRKMSTSSKNTDKATFYSPIEARATLAPASKITRGTRIRG